MGEYVECKECGNLVEITLDNILLGKDSKTEEDKSE